jgi:hypothetical protein
MERLVKLATASAFALVLWLFPAGAQGQHSHPQQHPQHPTIPAKPEEPTKPKATPPKAEVGAGEAQHQPTGEEPDATEALHQHQASGTARQPASTPSHMWMLQRGGWTLGAHGNLFLTFNHQGGAHGRGKLESMNWLMLIEQRRLGAGTIQFRQMFSAEPLTAPHGGFPQIFQTGETYRGAPIVDAQHPHDLFGELAVTYTLPLSERVSWEIYGGPVGEPALGPVAFMHRASASELPAAPLGHHVQDSTHIAPGVVTTGIIAGRFKAEVSAFNGREPDEVRHTIDFAPLDSWSVRLNFRPTPNWSMQYSYGRLNEPEALEEGDIYRQTASVSYNRPFAEGNWAATLLWGRNHKQVESTNQNSYLVESTVNFRVRNYAYTRLELLDRDELFPTAPDPRPQFRVGAYTFGGVRDLVQNDKWQMGLGADLTFYSKPAALDAFYGSRPVSFRIFLRFRPGRMKHDH